MSNIKRKTGHSTSAQQSLFDTGLEEGAFDISLGFRQCLSRAISGCGKDRYHIAAEVSRLTRSNFSKDMLDKYTSSDASYGIRAEVLTALCHVMNTLEPFRYLLEPLGSDVLDPADRELMELTRIQEQIKKLESEKLRILKKFNLEVKS